MCAQSLGHTFAAMFRFEHPYFLNLLWAVPVLLPILIGYLWWRKRALARLATPASSAQVLPGWSVGRFWFKNALFLIALALLALAWANPQRGAKQQTVMQQSADVFIALDISRSMLAEDVAPSRLDLAKSFVRKLIRALEGERIGLIFFAGDAFLQMPLSTDYAAADMFVASATPDLITAQGTAIPAAVDLASEHFDPDPGSGRALILVTDGENHESDATDRVAQAYSDGIITFAVGAGTAGGGPIPLGFADENGRYLRDDGGEIVRSRMDETQLKKLASAGGGAAYLVSQDEAAIRAIRREVGRLEKRATEVRSFSEFESYFQWFLLPALLLLVLETWFSWRKKSVVLALLCMLGPALSAQSAHKLLREGDKRYERGNYADAEQAYRRAGEKKPDDPKSAYNTGNALYKQGNYPDAEKQFERAAQKSNEPALQADALHNLGNTYLLQQKYPEAIQAYENSLRRRPADPETKANLQLAKKKWQQEQQKQQEQENQQNQQNQENQQNNDPNQKQENPPQKPDQPQQGDSPQQPANGQQQEEPTTPEQQQKMPREQARRLLETAVSPEDRRNAKKYREQEPGKHQVQPKKNW